MLNERPKGFVERICEIDGKPCEGQGTIAECDSCNPVDDITIWLRDQDEAGCHEAANELDRLRAALKTIERSGIPNATIVAKRDDDHACSWCRGMLTPCPVVTARLALTKGSTYLREVDEP